jgi:circadian clock protein KaiB
MTSTEHRPAHKRTEASLAPDAERYALTLFVSGASDSSAQAIANVRKICDAYLPGRHHLNIVDLHQDPALAAEHRVLATPTLVKDHPLPSRMLVGDMSDHRRILAGLDVDLSALVPGARALDARVPSAPR